MARRRLLSQLVCLRLRLMMLMAGVGLGTLLVMQNPFLPQGTLKIGYHTVMAQEATKSAPYRTNPYKLFPSAANVVPVASFHRRSPRLRSGRSPELPQTDAVGSGLRS
jgi:hypothetical protein